MSKSIKSNNNANFTTFPPVPVLHLRSSNAECLKLEFKLCLLILGDQPKLPMESVSDIKDVCLITLRTVQRR